MPSPFRLAFFFNPSLSSFLIVFLLTVAAVSFSGPIVSEKWHVPFATPRRRQPISSDIDQIVPFLLHRSPFASFRIFPFILRGIDYDCFDPPYSSLPPSMFLHRYVSFPRIHQVDARFHKRRPNNSFFFRDLCLDLPEACSSATDNRATLPRAFFPPETSFPRLVSLAPRDRTIFVSRLLYYCVLRGAPEEGARG